MIAHRTRKLKTAVATTFDTPQKHIMTQGDEQSCSITQSSLKKKREVSRPVDHEPEENSKPMTGDEFLQSHQDDVDQALTRQSFGITGDPQNE